MFRILVLLAISTVAFAGSNTKEVVDVNQKAFEAKMKVAKQPFVSDKIKDEQIKKIEATRKMEVEEVKKSQSSGGGAQ